MLTGRCKKAPPSGELAATIGSSLRGLASPWGSWRAAPEGVGLAAYNTKKRPALLVEMQGALVIQAGMPYASGWGCAAEDWAAMNSAASSGMSSRSSSLPMSTLSGGFLNRISYRMGTIYRVIRVA